MFSIGEYREWFDEGFEMGIFLSVINSQFFQENIFLLKIKHLPLQAKIKEKCTQ
jgi:hypothetical protein